MLALPSRTEIVEVSPRDGLQSHSRAVDTRTKIALVDALTDAGFPVIEVTAFSHPRAIPNLADAEAVMAGITRRPGTIYRALAPNLRGAERAVAAQADEVLGLATLSGTYTAKNQNMTVEQALDQAICAFALTQEAGRRFVMALGMSFWCPYEGTIPEADVLRAVERLHDAGVRRIYLAGSVGMEDPRHVSRLFARLVGAFPDCAFGYHVHDRAGFAPANILAALDGGARWLEGAVCGLGGGMAMPGGERPPGNYPTEDLVHLLEASGIGTGLDLSRVIAVAERAAHLLGLQPNSHVTQWGTRASQLEAARPRIPAFTHSGDALQ
ncbi:hydroxymethylglutaryl-CoA lyase [Azorhizobium sp. AG788]|uniref:hydroxymethylglutaryl-CoA lyase n=1 Tax=Azorhizobium sp. AG788 TaxID=2183897 RepID=UPI00313A1B26